jgi:hypothetical protein
MELRGYSPNSYIHVSVSDFYIPMIHLPILLQENTVDGPNVRMYGSITDTGMCECGNGTDTTQFLFWEYINPKFFAVCMIGCINLRKVEFVENLCPWYIRYPPRYMIICGHCSNTNIT